MYGFFLLDAMSARAGARVVVSWFCSPVVFLALAINPGCLAGHVVLSMSSLWNSIHLCKSWSKVIGMCNWDVGCFRWQIIVETDFQASHPCSCSMGRGQLVRPTYIVSQCFTYLLFNAWTDTSSLTLRLLPSLLAFSPEHRMSFGGNQHCITPCIRACATLCGVPILRPLPNALFFGQLPRSCTIVRGAANTANQHTGLTRLYCIVYVRSH